ncbi:MAG: haloacid dehalogenase-like hydrolase [Flavobacteriaceae bacterium]|nr:haloacid dehalogenase-like hydrolase [Flavobacteriaceae bacterium]
MHNFIKFSTVFLIFFVLLTSCKQEAQTNIKEVVKTETDQKDPLPSWNNINSKKEIIAYVDTVTDKNHPDFIPVKDRIATFDNDGTLWSEQPVYFFILYAMDRVKVMAKDNPEWKNKQPFKAVLENDMEALKKSGEKGLLQIIMATHTGISVNDFKSSVLEWSKTAKHPKMDKLYSEMVYQPMLELLNYLRDHDFKTYIVSGGEVVFIRVFLTEIYGIPEEQIIGTRLKTEYVYNDGKPYIKRLPELDFNNDKEGKAVNIEAIIGKKPVFASGNSDGDLQMLQWTASNKYKSFMLYVHHTDSVREWAYDRDSHIGKLDKGLDQAKKDGWTVIDMKKDWKVIYPFELN